MDAPSLHEQKQSLESIRSAIRKMEKALAQMARKSSNTTLIEKRLKALTTGLHVLEHIWNGQPHRYTREELVEARQVLEGLFPSIERIFAKPETAGPQKTLLERRLKALRWAVQAMDELT